MLELRIILMALTLISFHAFAKDDRNLEVNQINNPVSEKRIALVIGNSAYTESPLKNPLNDAKDVAAKLRTLGFEVIERNNLQTKQIGRTLSEFRSKLTPGAVALVFYAGHGLQIKGENFLPAVDAEIIAEEDVPNQSLSVKQIMDLLDGAKTRLNLVFLDACRNNPYSRNFRSPGGEGLARISAPSGTLISYATRPGSVAADGSGRNGLYTSKLLNQFDSSKPVELALKRVVSEVKEASQGRQEPWMEGSIEGDFCFAGCSSGGTQAAKPAPFAPEVDAETQAWQAAQDANTVDAYQAYLDGYAQGRYVTTAKIKLGTQKKIEDERKQQEKPEADQGIKAGLNVLTKADFNALPFDQAIKVVRGNGSRKMVVFSDPDCPFCKKLEQMELPSITDVTIYTFLFPLQGLHPDALNKSKTIWCAPDRVKAWQDWMLNGQLNKSGSSCDTPFEEVAELGRRLGILATPTLIFSNGKYLIGVHPSKEIETALAATGKN